MAILDFSKAFDTVPHSKLLHKLNHYGIVGPLHQWLNCFLTKRSMRVVLEGSSSETTTVDKVQFWAPSSFSVILMIYLTPSSPRSAYLPTTASCTGKSTPLRTTRPYRKI